MEKIFVFIQWWTNLTGIKKWLSFALGASIFIAFLSVTFGTVLLGKKDNLIIKETMQMSKDCDQRMTDLRNKYDSTLSVERKDINEERKTLYQRTNKIEDRNNAIKNALK